jgi:hypothetical protein
MASELNQPIKTGDPIKASTFESMRKVLAPLAKFTVEPPLELTQSSGSTNIRFAIPLIRYAVTTSSITAKVTSTRTLGKGAATLREMTYNTGGVGTYASTGSPVTVYNGDAGAIASGRLVIVIAVDGKWHVIVDYCDQ